MKNEPLVSINLPTFNGEDTIERALKSVERQTYKNYEIIVVDHYSKDKTIQIAKKYTNKIFFDKKRILNSRKIGLKKSKGEIIVFLSCDQVFADDFLEKTVKLFREKNIDMIINEERSYKPRTIIGKMTDLDRKMVHVRREINPSKSVLLPSTFKKDLLLKVFSKFDEELLANVTIHDHAIIYHEAYKLSKKVEYLEKAVFHEEPKTAKELFSHYYSWGRRARYVKDILPDEYKKMFDGKLRNRIAKVATPLSLEIFPTMPITLIKGAGFKLGYYFG